MNAARANDLGAIARNAFLNVPFYRALYSQHGLDEADFDDPLLFERLPIVTPQEFILREEPRCAKNARPYRVTSSSGTAGRPKMLFRTPGDTRRSTDIMVRLFALAGLRSGDVLWIGQPFDFAHVGFLSLGACEHLGVVGLPAGLSVTDDRMVDMLDRFAPNAIFTAPSRMMRLTEMFAARSSRPALSKILLAGEPSRSEQVSFLRDFWQAQIFDLYGSEETDGLAGSCVYGDGLHFMDDAFHLELVDPETKRPSNGDSGAAVITALHFKGTPLVRYLLGDVVARLDGACPCGSPWPRIAIKGRSNAAFALYDGVKLHDYQIRDAINGLGVAGLCFQAILRTDAHGADEVEVLLRYPAGAERIPAAKVDEALWTTSLDLEAPRSIGKLSFRVREVDVLEPTPRGKIAELVDRRPARTGALA
ncbi:MAG TPA: AMP-binding protein [Rhizomicrobium sp.]|nr:AMP-binding protein [Rhizomicrobium sp.]